jgi:hypothetical protein
MTDTAASPAGAVPPAASAAPALRAEPDEAAIASYRELRAVVGGLGFALPPLVVAWGLALHGSLQPSISAYYDWRTRDLLVGILFTIAWFFFSYRGYGKADDRAGNVACVAALGVAIFPTHGSQLDHHLHTVFSALLFLTLTYFCLFLFIKTDPKRPPTRRKLARNRVYRICGGLMIGCMVAIALHNLLGVPEWLASLKPVLWLEWTLLWAFGVAWLVKGEMVLKDEPAAQPAS